MPQNIVGADTWTLTVQCAADGDPVDGASQLLLGQDITDRSLYLRNRTLGPVGSSPYYHVPLDGQAHLNNFAFDVPAGAPPTFGRKQTGTGGLADYYGAAVPAPVTGRITSVEAIVDGDLGGGGPHVALPAVLPTLTLYRQDEEGSTSGMVATATDPSGTFAAYDLKHEIKITGLTEDIDDHVTWWVVLTGEGGAGALANSLYLIDIRFTVEPAP